jgi:ribosomal protein S6
MIMLNPSEMKHRAQLMYAVQARAEDDFMTQNLNVFKTRYNELKRCAKFHDQITQLKTINKKQKNPKFRVQFTLLKALSQEKLLSSK